MNLIIPMEVNGQLQERIRSSSYSILCDAVCFEVISLMNCNVCSNLIYFLGSLICLPIDRNDMYKYSIRMQDYYCICLHDLTHTKTQHFTLTIQILQNKFAEGPEWFIISACRGLSQSTHINGAITNTSSPR